MRAVPAVLFALTLALMLLRPAASPAADYPIEYAVKATYLVKFAPFVDWPPGSFASLTSPLDLCVLGDDPVARLVDLAARGAHADRHPIVTRHLRSPAEHAGCHILYIATPELERSPGILDSLRGVAVLTVTALPGGDQTTGIINFVIRDARVRFEVDNRLAAAAGITISSKLLSLAVSVRPRA